MTHRQLDRLSPQEMAKRRAELQIEVKSVFEEGGGNPRVHPNGFIQLDLEPVPESWHASHQRGHSGASRRLHIWNPVGIDLPRQHTHNEVHDHVFDMHSLIMYGCLTQHLFGLEIGTDEPATHEMYRAVYEKNSDSRLMSIGIVGVLDRYQSFTIMDGQSYTQPAFTFHDSAPSGLVVTVMTKQTIHDGEAHVLCPIGVEPDNDFDRASAASSKELWSAIMGSIQ